MISLGIPGADAISSGVAIVVLHRADATTQRFEPRCHMGCVSWRSPVVGAACVATRSQITRTVGLRCETAGIASDPHSPPSLPDYSDAVAVALAEYWNV